MDFIQGPQMNRWTPGYTQDMRFSQTDTAALFDNYVKALAIRRKAQEMGAIFGGKLPHVGNLVPGGALGHWVSVSSSKISGYQVITPTCRNASPMDDNGNSGPMEKALIGIQVADINHPIELLRIVHSFDPCLACSVHVMTPEGVEMFKFIVQPIGG